MAASYQAMLATASTYASGDQASRVAAWRQIVDILGQTAQGVGADEREQAFAALGKLAGDVPLAQRRLASASLAGRLTDRALIALFTHDVPAVAAPMLAKLSVSEADWLALVPTLPAASRNILRNRRDLPDVAVSALGRFAAVDLTLPVYGLFDGAASSTGESVDQAKAETTPILDLVERIAQYRQRTLRVDGADAPAVTPIAHDFVFETDGDGTIVWVEGAPRAAIVGLSLAQAAEPGESGADAAAASAWRRRAPLGPCRLLIGGESEASGDWTIEAAPLFNPATGRFVGFRGEARRPRPGERALVEPADAHAHAHADPGAATDSIRQLVHELRTPLNAIQGFAGMIEGQWLGPAAAAHREHARSIVAEVERMVALIDDLDLAARLDVGRWAPLAPAESIAASVEQAVTEQRVVLAERGVTLNVQGGGARADGGAIAANPIVARLLGVIGATASTGEAIAVSILSIAGRDVIGISRPAALRGVLTGQLLDPDLGSDGAWPDASLLGLGFTLRLCARLAGEQGGRLTIGADAFELSLPAVDAQDNTVAR